MDEMLSSYKEEPPLSEQQHADLDRVVKERKSITGKKA